MFSPVYSNLLEGEGVSLSVDRRRQCDSPSFLLPLRRPLADRIPRSYLPRIDLCVHPHMHQSSRVVDATPARKLASAALLAARLDSDPRNESGQRGTALERCVRLRTHPRSAAHSQAGARRRVRSRRTRLQSWTRHDHPTTSNVPRVQAPETRLQRRDRTFVGTRAANH